MLKLTFLFIALFFGFPALASEDMQPVKVEIKKTAKGFQLFRGGKPYFIRGAGIEVDDFDAFAANGGNSIRNWTTRNENAATMDILDKAHALGITVSLCLPMEKEHWGFDYSDEKAVARQLANMREEVLKYRNHPALLTWIIGNELNFDYTNSKVYDAVNDVAKMIHELDPNHPTTTTIAGLGANVIEDIKQRAPAIDFISIQVYGQLALIPEFIKEIDYDGSYMVTEWGTIGFWEMPKTEWGAPIEMNSSEKAANTLRGYQQKIQSMRHRIIGDHVFLWGQKQERTPTWFGMFVDTGEATESVDVMHYAWNKKWPRNRSPKLVAMKLNGKTAHQNVRLKPATTYRAVVAATDPDRDKVSYRWELKPESDSKKVGGDFEENINSIANLIKDDGSGNIQLTAPETSGAYRLFVYVYDGQGHAAHANIPFYVD